MPTITLVSGVPRAGKSSFCDAVEASGAGFTHVPLDRYVLPVPRARTFLDWIADPACIAWDRLRTHLAILGSGVACYSPRPHWEAGWRAWRSDGGALGDGPGRRMQPARTGYLLAGTHAFAFPAGAAAPLRVYVQTSAEVVAERLTGARLGPAQARAVLLERLAGNTVALLGQARAADLVVDGTAERPVQVRRFLGFHAEFFAHPPVAGAPAAPAA